MCCNRNTPSRNNFPPNVKEHATLSAGARVDHGVKVEIVEKHVNRAADGVAVSRLVRLLGLHGGSIHGSMHQVLVLPKCLKPLNQGHAYNGRNKIPKALETRPSKKTEGGHK